MTIAVQGAGVRHNRGDRSRWTPTAAQSERIPTHEPDRGRRLLPSMPRAAPLASSRLSRSLSRHNDRLHGEFSSVISLGSMACRSRAYADDGLSLASQGPVQVGEGIIEGQGGADVRPHSTVPHPLTISVGWARSDSTTNSTAKPLAGRASAGPAMVTKCLRCDSGLQSASGVASEDVENQIGRADVFQGVVLEVNELLCA